jgi:hypothetical protein
MRKCDHLHDKCWSRLAASLHATQIAWTIILSATRNSRRPETSDYLRLWRKQTTGQICMAQEYGKVDDSFAARTDCLEILNYWKEFPQIWEVLEMNIACSYSAVGPSWTHCSGSCKNQTVGPIRQVFTRFQGLGMIQCCNFIILVRQTQLTVRTLDWWRVSPKCGTKLLKLLLCGTRSVTGPSTADRMQESRVACAMWLK